MTTNVQFLSATGAKADVSPSTPLPVSAATVPGFDLPTYDSIALSYDEDGNLSQVEYLLGEDTVATLDLTYDELGNLLTVARSV